MQRPDHEHSAAQWRSASRGVSQVTLASSEGQAIPALCAVGSVALAVDGATRMRFARLASLAVQPNPGGPHIGTSAPCLALRMLAVGGCVVEAWSFARLSRQACEMLCVRMRGSTGERCSFEFAG